MNALTFSSLIASFNLWLEPSFAFFKYTSPATAFSFIILLYLFAYASSLASTLTNLTKPLFSSAKLA